MKTKSSSRQKWLYGTIGLSVMLCIVVLSFNGLKAKAANLKEMIESNISDSTDSKKTQKETATEIKTKKIIAKSNVKLALPVVTTNQTLPTDEKTINRPAVRESSKSTEQSINYKMPQFDGGNMALSNYISKNVVYPSDALEKKIQGMVLVRLSINELGKVKKAEIRQGVNPSLDKEAIRVANALPDFTPGEVDGKKASLTYVFPISFKIDKDNKPDVNGLAIEPHDLKNLNIYELLRIYPRTSDEKVVLNLGERTDPNRLMAEINSDEIQSVTILNAKDATDKYGEKGKNGTIEIIMKKKDN